MIGKGKISVIAVLGLVLMGTLLMSGCTEDDETKKISIVGSSTVLPIAQQCAEKFNDDHDDIQVTVKGGGSGAGIDALGQGTADIADASRPIKQSEIDEYPDIDFTDNVVAKDGVAIIVSKEIHDAGVTGLTTQQVVDIYVGTITNWKDVGGPDETIFVVEREEGSGTRDTFMDALGLEETSADSAKDGNSKVKTSVKTSNNAIGYVGLGYVGDDTPSITLDGVMPSESTIASGDYGITRSLHMYTDGEPKGAVKEFIDYVQSDEGQQIVADEGFIRVN